MKTIEIKNRIGRPSKSLDEKKIRESAYNKQYYLSKVKTKKILDALAQTCIERNSKLTAKAYRKSIVEAFSQYGFTHFFTGTSSPNYIQKESLKLINKDIAVKNDYYASNISLMKFIPISVNGLERYANKFLMHLMDVKCIDRAIIFYETNKSGEWHVHVMLNVINTNLVDVNSYIEDKWLLGICLNVPIPTEQDKVEILNYSTKQINPQIKTKISSDKSLFWNLVGDYTNKENLNCMSETKQERLKKFVEIYKLKNNIFAKADKENQRKLENKFVKVDR